MIKAYFFAWMGTLGSVDNEKSIREIINNDEHNALLTKVFDNTGINENRKNLIYSKLSNAKLQLYPDSEEVIENLKGDYKLAIISNVYEITSQRIKDLFPKFLNKFDFITWSCEVGMKKPNMNIFLYTLNNLGFPPEEVVMIGDSQDKDINPALSLWMQARLIDRSKQNLEDVI